MGPFLFPNFLQDANEYQQAEALWRHHWDEVVRQAGEAEWWKTPWLDTALLSGTPCRDGNPIFTAASLSRPQAVRVIQLPPAGNPSELYFWTDVFAKGEPEEKKELVISCALSRQTLLDAVDLMNQWVNQEAVY